MTMLCELIQDDLTLLFADSNSKSHLIPEYRREWKNEDG